MSAQDERIFTVYPLITILAASEEEAAQKLYALHDWINAQPGVQTELDEECYEIPDGGGNDEPWQPVRIEAAPLRARGGVSPSGKERP